MFLDGIVEETIRARRDAGFSLDSPQGTAIGYRQVLDYIDAKLVNGDFSRAGLLDCLTKVQNATRPYVRHQLLWFRSEQLYQFMQAETPPVPLSKSACMPLDHYSISPAAAAQLEDSIVHQFSKREFDYWNDLLSPESQADQERIRMSAKDERITRQLKRYQTKLQILHQDSVVDSILQNIQRVWHESNPNPIHTNGTNSNQ